MEITLVLVSLMAFMIAIVLSIYSWNRYRPFSYALLVWFFVAFGSLLIIPVFALIVAWSKSQKFKALLKIISNLSYFEGKSSLFNQQEFSTFKKTIETDANLPVYESEQLYNDLHRGHSFKTHFEKKNFLEDILESSIWRNRLNFNYFSTKCSHIIKTSCLKGKEVFVLLLLLFGLVL